MPTDAVSRTANVERTGRLKWVPWLGKQARPDVQTVLKTGIYRHNG